MACSSPLWYTRILQSSLHSKSYAAKLIRLCEAAGDLTFFSCVSPGGGCILLLAPVDEYLLPGQDSCPSSRTPAYCRARFALLLKWLPVARNCLRTACARNVCFGFALPYALRSEVKQKSSIGEPSERKS